MGVSWTIKKAEHRRIGAFELWCWRRLLRVPWTARRSNQWILKEINPEYSLEGHAEAEAPILWPPDVAKLMFLTSIPDVRNWLIGKDPDAGKDWRREEKGTTEDEMVGWHHWLDGPEFEEARGVGDGQGSLVCCSPWGRKESDMTERLNWTDTHPEPFTSHRVCLGECRNAFFNPRFHFMNKQWQSARNDKEWNSGGKPWDRGPSYKMRCKL